MRNRLKVMILIPGLAWLPICLGASPESSAIPVSREKNELSAYAWGTLGTLVPLVPGLIYGVKALGPGNQDANATIGGVSLALALLGPSYGQYYAGSWGIGTLGIIIRGLGGFVMEIGALGPPCVGLDCPTYEPNPGTIVAGGLIVAGGAAYSFWDTHYSVKRANAKAKSQRFGLFPQLVPSLNGGLKPGMLAWAKF